MSSGSILDELDAYKKNPYFREDERLFGDFTPFYIAISICTIFAALLFLLNFVLGCCTSHKTYWSNRHTGNRWLVSLWTVTPHKQPPLDIADIEAASTFQQDASSSMYNIPNPEEYLELQRRDPELQKRESEI